MNDFWKGRARKLDDIDIPRIGATIGVGEDPIHAVMDTEARSSGFDGAARVVMLFEPHVFYREVPEPLRAKAEADGLAYPKWGQRKYPSDSYPVFQKAYALNARAALRSASWGLGQVMGFNSSLAGFDTAQAMVEAFAADEEHQLEGMVNFIRNAGLDDELRDLEAAKTDAQMLDAAARFARGYNGPGYAKNGYDKKIVQRFKWWKGKPDTPWTRDMLGQSCPLAA